jgi:hypothetical protein
MREPRLGDIIDDYCVKCKRIMNHSVVSILNEQPAKVRCRTCHSDHDYRHEQAPPPKVDLRKQALFQEVLEKVDPAADPVVDEDEEETVEEAMEAEEIVEAEEPVEPVKPVKPVKAPPAKAKKKIKHK